MNRHVTVPRKEFIIIVVLVTVFVLAGFVLLGCGARFWLDTRTFLADAAHTEGHVVGFETYDPGTQQKRGKLRYSVVRFTTPDGREINFRGPSQEWAWSYNKGETVPVVYPPASPEKARIDTFMGLWFAPAMLGGLGFFAVVLPLLTLYRHLKENTQTS